MNNTISKKYIKDYITQNYGELRHDLNRMVKACRTTSKIYGYTPKQIFHFMIEQEPLSGTHSYGFNTAYGREIREEFQTQYYQIYKPI